MGALVQVGAVAGHDLTLSQGERGEADTQNNSPSRVYWSELANKLQPSQRAGDAFEFSCKGSLKLYRLV
jgi:hypothetical protein